MFGLKLLCKIWPFGLQLHSIWHQAAEFSWQPYLAMRLAHERSYQQACNECIRSPEHSEFHNDGTCKKTVLLWMITFEFLQYLDITKPRVFGLANYMCGCNTVTIWWQQHNSVWTWARVDLRLWSHIHRPAAPTDVTTDLNWQSQHSTSNYHLLATLYRPHGNYHLLATLYRPHGNGCWVTKCCSHTSTVAT